MAAADLAFRLLRSKGRTDGILRRPSNDFTVDPARPWAPGDTDPAVDPIVQQGLAVLILDKSFSKLADTVDDREVQSLHPEATAIGYVADQELSDGVALKDTLQTAGTIYTVLQIDTLQPDDTKVLHILHLVS